MGRKKSDATDQPATEETVSAADLLRAFEDEKLGPDAPRWDGKVERGHGSLWARMSDEDKARHAELEAAADAAS